MAQAGPNSRQNQPDAARRLPSPPAPPAGLPDTAGPSGRQPWTGRLLHARSAPAGSSSRPPPPCRSHVHLQRRWDGTLGYSAPPSCVGRGCRSAPPCQALPEARLVLSGGGPRTAQRVGARVAPFVPSVWPANPFRLSRLSQPSLPIRWLGGGERKGLAPRKNTNTRIEESVLPLAFFFLPLGIHSSRSTIVLVTYIHI